MSYYTDYSPEPVTRTIIAVSCISIVGALPLIGLSLVAKPAHLATRGTRIAWYLTGLAALILLSSHIVPLVVAVWFIRSPKMATTRSEGSDLGPVAFALMGLTLIFEIAACRSVFYATLPLGVTRAKKWTFIFLDMLSFGALVGTFIGALVGTADYETGMCGNSCTSPRDVAAIFFDNTNTSGGMHITSLFSLIVVLAGAIASVTWSPYNPLARSLRISLPILAVVQLALTLACIFTWLTTYSSETWDEKEYDSIYYSTIPFSWVELVILWFVQIALKRNPTNVVPLEGADLDVALEAQPAEKLEPTATA